MIFVSNANMMIWYPQRGRFKRETSTSQHPQNQGQPRVAMMPTLSSLAAPEVVIMTTSGAASDDKIGIMSHLGFQYLVSRVPYQPVKFQRNAIIEFFMPWIFLRSYTYNFSYPWGYRQSIHLRFQSHKSLYTSHICFFWHKSFLNFAQNISV